MRERVQLLPGECFATDRDVAVVTVLGSCVSACLRDPVRGVGGMNHFMLPRASAGEGPASVSARYGVHAMELLINQLLQLGARRGRLEAKVFGGGNVLEGMTMDIGGANAEFVKRFLATEKIRVSAEDLGGARSRKIYYYPRSGRVLVRTLLRGAERVAEQESELGRRILELPAQGEVELFEKG